MPDTKEIKHGAEYISDTRKDTGSPGMGWREISIALWALAFLNVFWRFGLLGFIIVSFGTGFLSRLIHNPERLEGWKVLLWHIGIYVVMLEVVYRGCYLAAYFIWPHKSLHFLIDTYFFLSDRSALL